MIFIAAAVALFSLGAAAPVADCSTEAATTSTCTTITQTITTTVAPCAATPAAASTTSESAATTASAVGTNVQAFAGALGGPPPPVVSGTGERPFSVNGDTFVGAGAALGRSCDVQHNACADAANSGQLSGGVGQCDQQNDECRQANAVSKRGGEPPPGLRIRAALDLGSCGDASILFEEGLDGRDQAAFVAANQADFSHGSALKIGVIADFICQRLGSSCDAPDDTQTACKSASSAAAAETQDQAAADAFNSVMAGAANTAAASAASSEAGDSSAAVETTIVQIITSCVWMGPV